MDSHDPNLPPRLFATDHFPTHTLNIYCKLDTLTFLHQTLKGTQVWETIRGSCFGKLFELPLNTCPISCKLVHSLLTRQLVTEMKYVLWTVFGGFPLRFSLFEFGEITGLHCGKFPPDHDPDDDPKHDRSVDPCWKQLIGDDIRTTLADITSMLEEDKDKEEMSYSRKLGLALILIVDGVLISKSQVNRPTLKYVQMVVKDVDAFLEFPWGRESFLRTIRCMKPNPSEDAVTVFRNQLKRKYRLQGFPLVLQLVAFRAIPALLAKLPASSEPQILLDLTVINIPKYPCLTLMDVLEVENQSKLKVIPIIDIAHIRSKYWGKWSDETTDTSVDYLEGLITTGHRFSKSSWHGGDDSEPLLAIPQKNKEPAHKEHVAHKKHVVERRKVVANSNFLPKKRSSASAKRKKQKRLQDALINQALREQVATLRLRIQKKDALIVRLKRKGRFKRKKRCDIVNVMDTNGLEPSQQLSSEIVNFYMSYLEELGLASRINCYLFNSFFYTKLTETFELKDMNAGFVKLRRWWKGIDLFSKSYLFIPICKDNHWSLVIVCIPDKECEERVTILHLDSIRGQHPKESIVDNIKRFLIQEWDQQQNQLTSSVGDLPFSEMINDPDVECPQQNNEFDCGVFVLLFTKWFMENAPPKMRKSEFEMINNIRIRPEEASALRIQIKNRINDRG